METKNFIEDVRNEAAIFVATWNQKKNDVSTNNAIKENASRAETARLLSQTLQGFNATCKVLTDYVSDHESEKANKESYISFYRLDEIKCKTPAQVKAYISENLPLLADTCSRICSPFTASFLNVLKRETHEAREALAAHKANGAISNALKVEAAEAVEYAKRTEAEAKKAAAALSRSNEVIEKVTKENFEAAKAENDKAREKAEAAKAEAVKAADEAKPFIDIIKKGNAEFILNSRFEEALKRYEIAQSEFLQAIEKAEFKPVFNKDANLIGALAPVTKWTPNLLASFVKKAAKAAQTKTKGEIVEAPEVAEAV